MTETRCKIVSGGDDSCRIVAGTRRWLNIGSGLVSISAWAALLGQACDNRDNVALHFMYYNFCKIHQSLRVTPAMEAGLSDHVWDMRELVALVEHREIAASA